MKKKIPGESSACVLIAVEGDVKVRMSDTQDDLSQVIKPRSEED